MVWSAPMTAVDLEPFTAAEFNMHVRDNFLETAPGKAAEAGHLIVSDGANSITTRKAVIDVLVRQDKCTDPIGFRNLAVRGPQVTVETGSSAMVMWGAWFVSVSNATSGLMSFEIEGPSGHIAASVDNSIQWDGIVAGNSNTGFGFTVVTGLTPGVHEFTAMYSATDGDFSYRKICVIPL